MWLPKEERQLLRFYYDEVKKSNSTPTYEKWYSEEDLLSVVGYREQAEELDIAGFKKSIKECTTAMANVSSANVALVERKLIELKAHQSQKRVGVSLTIDGYDLGRKYSCWFISTGLLYAEYKHHWLFLIATYMAGIFSACIVGWLIG